MFGNLWVKPVKSQVPKRKNSWRNAESMESFNNLNSAKSQKSPNNFNRMWVRRSFDSNGVKRRWNCWPEANKPSQNRNQPRNKRSTRNFMRKQHFLWRANHDSGKFSERCDINHELDDLQSEPLPLIFYTYSSTAYEDPFLFMMYYGYHQFAIFVSNSFHCSKFMFIPLSTLAPLT